ncbi:MAG: putative tellurium resistance membrane protein TerC [Lentimonas sp.]
MHVVTLDGSNEDTKHNASVVKTLSLIVIFSLDSILSAMAITKIT